jgi:hypothetical protein
MGLLVDTSVWSLALRRDTPPEAPEVEALSAALHGEAVVATCGIVLLELHRGLLPGRVRDEVTDRLSHLTWLEPQRDDYLAAADLATTCRRSGVQLGTVDSLIAQLAIAHDLDLLTTDQDFAHASAHIPLRVWGL